MELIILSEQMTQEEIRRALDYSLMQGFMAQSAEYPVTLIKERHGIPRDLSSVIPEELRPTETLPDDFLPSSDSAQPIPDMDWRPRKGLENLFGNGLFFADYNYDQLPDEILARFQLPSDCSVSVLAAACNLAHRFGMETTGFTGSLLADADWEGPLVTFTGVGSCSLDLIGEDQIIISGAGTELIAFISRVCEPFPELPSGRNWIWQLQEMTDSLALLNLDGQLAQVEALTKEADTIKVYASPEIDERLEVIRHRFPNVSFQNHKARQVVYEQSFDLPWEVTALKTILEDHLYPLIRPGDEVRICGRLSEAESLRRDLEGELRQELTRRGAVSSQVQILCAYKQGYSWLMEEILPRLQKVNVQEITIAFQPFLAPGITEWGDVDGAVPSYAALGSGDSQHWYDLPIRYLQEIYPADDGLAHGLVIPKEAIHFETYQGNEDLTYQVTARNGTGETVLAETFKAAWSERPYLHEYPQAGLVHPGTGLLEVWINGQEVLRERIPTDLETIWDQYQASVLPRLRQHILDQSEGTLSAADQPFFAQLELVISASEPDERLPWRQDLFSSVDAFHEDLYFVGSDYFKFLGAQHGGAVLDAPGLILPRISVAQGRPQFKAVLHEQLMKIPQIHYQAEKTNGTDQNEVGEGVPAILTPKDRRAIQLYIRSLSWEAGELCVHLATDLADGSFLAGYGRLLGEGILEVAQYISAERIIIEGPAGTYPVRLPPREKTVSDRVITDIDLLESTLIGYDQYLEIIRQLERVDGLLVYPIARSYLGRIIHAVEFKTKRSGYVSRTKRLTRQPSLYINARHHANEVSSTNAAFLLIRKILTDDTTRDLAQRLNLVIVPMENPDGTQIHYELQQEHPLWKLHVARFNAMGKEFYRDHFDPDTIHTEAMGLTRLWQKMLPDVMVDNHGVPSHEWDQQFSGYTSPSFKGFWIPRSLLYGYFWYVTDERFAANQTVNRALEHVIAQAILGEEAITAVNQEWMEIFEKYAHGWMPKLFPADYYQNMINYWIPFAFDPSHRYPSIRFPWITSVAYTSEVADETAQGDYLTLCARTHLVHDMAIIDALCEAKLPMERRWRITDNSMELRERRLRPLLMKKGQAPD